MNKKGFTLIEMLSVIVILAIVLVVTIPSSVEAYKKSKLKTEETFVERLSQVVAEYTSLNADTLRFEYMDDVVKPGEKNDVSVYMANASFQNLIDQKLIKSSDYSNPNNKDQECNTSARIEIYKDSDFVYCHRVKANELNCLTTDYIDYIKKQSNNVEEENPYVIDTCIWE